MCIGDFNAVRGSHERRNSVIPPLATCRDFENFISDRDLIEVPTSGLFYYWYSRRLLPEHVESKLDRALVDNGFMDAWDPMAGVLLPRNCSDHSPLAVKCIKNSFSGPRHFIFGTCGQIMRAFWVWLCSRGRNLLFRNRLYVR